MYCMQYKGNNSGTGASENQLMASSTCAGKREE